MSGPSAGRQGRRWRRLHAEQKAKGLPCWLCGQAIKYDAEKSDPESFTVDHVIPLSRRRDLAEEPTNLRSAHARCNKERGARAPQPALGTTSREW